MEDTDTNTNQPQTMGDEGFEPPTKGLWVPCSDRWANRPKEWDGNYTHIEGLCSSAFI